MAERILNFIYLFYLGGGGEGIYRRTPTCKGSGDLCKIIILYIFVVEIAPSPPPPAPPPGSALPSYFQPFTIETVD